MADPERLLIPEWIGDGWDSPIGHSRMGVWGRKRAEVWGREDLPIFYVAGSVTSYAFRDYVKGFRKAMATRFAFHGGSAKYWWLDK